MVGDFLLNVVRRSVALRAIQTASHDFLLNVDPVDSRLSNVVRYRIKGDMLVILRVFHGREQREEEG